MLNPSLLSSGITLREEETVQQILSEPQNGEFQLDEQLRAMIENGEATVEAEYEAQAEERMARNRQGINFEESKDAFELEEGEQEALPPPPTEQHELTVFERDSVKKSKITEQEILELDSQFPKLTYSSMVGQQQNIFGLQHTEASKWLAHRRVRPEDLASAVACRVGEKIWIMIAIRHELLIFMGALAAEPFSLPHAATVTAFAFSPCKRYLAVGVQAQLAVYEVRKGNSIVLLKNINDLKVKRITKLGFYEGHAPRIYFIDEINRLAVVTIDVGLILTKVKIEEIEHGLQTINSCDIVRLNSKDVLIAITGAKTLRLASIEPEIQFCQNVEMSGGGAVCVWRQHKEKVQLLVGCQNRLVIYRLSHLPEEECYYLQEHLLFLNHYPISNLILISQFHLLLQSDTNFTVVGLPLIPSVVQDPDLLQSQGAIVYVLIKEAENRILHCVEECMLLFWGGQLQIGRLKTLQEYVDELMVQKCAYREALSLLVLVSRGINYSFRFSYQVEDLKKIIYGAIQMSASALLPSLDRKIVLFRVGWVVQLCIECHQLQLLWSTFYPALREKGMERLLFEMIQVFVLKNQLTSIPEDIFLDLVAYYAEKEQELIIEKLVLANQEEFEATKLLSLLNQKEMNYLQFYLFSKGILSQECDFYTPFLRAFTAFSRNADSQSPKRVQSGLLCLLILSKTFCFQHVPTGMMTRDTRELVVKEFFLQTMAKTFVKRLSQFNLRLFLEIYLLPFANEEFKDILLEDETEVIQRLRDYSIEEQVKGEPTFVSLFLDHMEHCLGPNRNSILFAEFYASALFLNQTTAKFERIVQILALFFEKKLYRYELRITPEMRPPTAKIKEFLVGLIQPQLCQRLDRLYIKKLLVFEDREVGYMLHRIDRNYQAALEHYLGNRGTEGLFQFVAEIYAQAEGLPEDSNFQRTRKKLQIRNFLIRNIGLLFRTDSVAALETLYMVGETSQKIHDFIFNGHFEQQQRLHFLTAVLTKWHDEEFEHKQRYLLEHLEEVCQLPQKEMRHYLDHFFYPLDLAIKVADQKGNFLAKAILQTRIGMIQQAFSSYQRLIKNTLVGSREEEETRGKVNRYIQECVQLCKLYSGENFEENLWVRLIKFISSFVASEHQYKVYLKVELQRANQSIIAEMLRFLGTSLLIKFFTSPSIPLPLHKLIPIYAELFRKVKFDKTTVQRSLLVFKIDLQHLRASISVQNKLAIRAGDFCDFCRGKLGEEDKNIIYSCGHAFHSICHDNPLLCLTCSYESDQILFFKAIFKKTDTIKKPESAAKQKKKVLINTDIYVKTQAEARMEYNRKRMKVFDYQQQNSNNRIYELTNKQFQIDSIIYQ